jgi:uncharacterized repeat protein (TIGR01451 family)
VKRRPSLPRFAAALLALSIVLSQLSPTPIIRAQAGDPAPTETATPAGTVVYDSGSAGVSLNATPQAAEAASMPEPGEPTPVVAEEELAAEQGPGGAETKAEPELLNAVEPQQNSPLKIDVIVNPTLRAGSALTYTVLVTNTASTVAVSAAIQLSFSPSGLQTYSRTVEILVDGQRRFDEDIALKFVPFIANNTAKDHYWPLGDIPAGKTARVVFVMDTDPTRFPRTGETPVIAGATGRVRINGNTGEVQNSDNSGALIIGPVFVLTKTPAPATFLAGTNVTFTISLGNATGAKDVVSGKVREDAIDTQSITLTETLPSNAAFVAASAGGVYDAASRTVTWTFARMRVSEQTTVTVTMRIADTATSCSTINNNLYTVTSNEMPFAKGQTTRRLVVNGTRANADIQPPIELELSAAPATIFAQGQSSVLVKVKNYLPRPTEPVTLTLNMAGSASSPVPSSGVVDGTSVTWRNIVLPAAANGVPSETRFTAVVTVDSVTGTRRPSATISGLPNVPPSCLELARTNLKVLPLIELNKTVDKDFVRIGEIVTYRIEAKNVGDRPVTGLIITDTLPFDDANFRFAGEVGATPAPSRNTDNRIVAWDLPLSDSIDPGESRFFEFEAIADGKPGAGGCYENLVTASSVESQIDKIEEAEVCLEAPFLVEKIITPGNVDPTAANKDVTVFFKITEVYRPAQFTSGRIWFKEEPQVPPTEVSLGSGSPSVNELEFVSVISDTSVALDPAEKAKLDLDGGVYWRNVASTVGQSVSGALRMRVKDGATVGKAIDDIVCVGYEPVTPDSWCIYDLASVTYNQRVLKVTKAVDRAKVSLGERVKYTISVAYETPTNDATEGVIISDTLPLEFTFEGMAPNFPAPTSVSVVTTTGEARTQLLWKNIKLNPKQTIKLEFYARASSFIGTYGNWAWAGSEAAASVRPSVACGTGGGCLQGPDGPAAFVRDVQTSQRITIDPEVVTSTLTYTRGSVIDYKISLVSVNDIAYTNTVITATLPPGFSFESMVGAGVSAPQRLPGGVLVWQGISVPAKGTSASGLFTLRFKARAAGKFGIFRMRVDAKSPTGTIPSVEGATLVFGASGPTLSLNAPPLVDLGSTFVVGHNLINPDLLTVTVQVLTVTLPANLEYMGMAITGTAAPIISGNPISGTTLVWRNLELPPARNDELGTLLLDFYVKAPEDRGQFTARSSIQASKPVDTSGATTAFRVERTLSVWLPMIRRQLR